METGKWEVEREEGTAERIGRGGGKGGKGRRRGRRGKRKEGRNSGKREGTAEWTTEGVRRCRGGVRKWKPFRHFGRKKTDFAKELGVYGQDPTRKKGFRSN